MTESPKPEASRLNKWKPWFPWIIFLSALLLRIWGSGWGLPNQDHHWSFHPDEPSLYVYSRQIEPAKLDFEPGFYNYGTLYLTALRLFGDFAVRFAGPDPEPWQEMCAVGIAGRWINIFAGAGTALVLFLMLRRRVGDIGGLFGSLLIAFAPGLVIHSRFQTVDVLATFFLALSAYFALKLFHEGEEEKPIKATLWSGIFAGLSAATKYTGILGLLTLIAAIFFSKSTQKLKLVLTGLASSVVTFLIFTPGVFLNWPKFSEDFQYEIQHTSQGHGIVFAGLPSGFLWHITNLFIGVGPVLVAMGVIGLTIGCFKKDKPVIALAAFYLAYYILIGRAEVLFLRYTFPLLIGLAYGFGWLVQWSLERNRWRLAVPAFGMIGLGGLFGGGLAAAAAASLWMAGEDSRDEAAKYIKSISKPGTTVGLVQDPWYYTPTFYYDTGAPRFIRWELRDAAMRQNEDPKLLRYVPENPDERFDWDTRLLDQKPDYVVFTSFETEGVDRLRTAKTMSEIETLLTDRFVAFYTRLKEEYDLDRTFGGTADRFGAQIHDIEYIRPLIWIWKRRAQ